MEAPCCCGLGAQPGVGLMVWAMRKGRLSGLIAAESKKPRSSHLAPFMDCSLSELLTPRQKKASVLHHTLCF
jgi:hypothetical protein